MLFVMVVAVGADRARECRSECEMNRGALDPLRDCCVAIRRATAQGSSTTRASNACLKAFMAAFRDECPRACMADSLKPMPPSCDDDACRVGHEAGIRQSRRLFLVEDETKEETAPSRPLVPHETAVVVYRGSEQVIAKYEGQTWQQAAAVWCRDSDGASPECPRILLMLLDYL